MPDDDQASVSLSMKSPPLFTSSWTPNRGFFATDFTKGEHSLRVPASKTVSMSGWGVRNINKSNRITKAVYRHVSVAEQAIDSGSGGANGPPAKKRGQQTGNNDVLHHSHHPINLSSTMSALARTSLPREIEILFVRKGNCGQDEIGHWFFFRLRQRRYTITV